MLWRLGEYQSPGHRSGGVWKPCAKRESFLGAGTGLRRTPPLLPLGDRFTQACVPASFPSLRDILVGSLEINVLNTRYFIYTVLTVSRLRLAWFSRTLGRLFWERTPDRIRQTLERLQNKVSQIFNLMA